MAMDARAPLEEEKFAISEQVCTWTIRILSALRSRLRIHIKMHHHECVLDEGQIFLFNHFARFETFIPQYLIHLETGAYCRSIASKDFFGDDGFLSDYLLSLGAVPNNYPNLLPFLGAEILRGRKVVIFPEGGMVKDRQVLDEKGRYNIYSRSAKVRRKHHSGAAVLAVTMDAFKVGIQGLAKAGMQDHLERWAALLKIDSVEALVAQADKPTRIIPSNITFYPIRLKGNILHSAAKFFGRHGSKQFSEEMIIEGNILLRNTDMDIRLSDNITCPRVFNWLEQKFLTRLLCRAPSLEALFEPIAHLRPVNARLLNTIVQRRVPAVRDCYMEEMYKHVTINLSHLASTLIMTLIGEKRMEIESDVFHKILYLTIKEIQREPSVYLHRSLQNPEYYAGILEGECVGLHQFMTSAESVDLISCEGGQYKFLPDLCKEYDFDEIRMENPIAVYANEMAPITKAVQAIDKAEALLEKIGPQDMARSLFDDMRVLFFWEKKQFSNPRYAEINNQETATQSGEPFFRMPNKSNGLGVVLVHGFLASPAELRNFSDRLVAAGHPVIGVRLNGHGTSPWDLRERDWENWQQPVREGYKIMAACSDRVALVGFSTGGALSLLLASEKPPGLAELAGLAGVVAVSVPLKFMNRNLIFVPLVHRINKIVRWVPSLEGVMPFRLNDSEHSDINYRNVPIRGLYEVGRMVAVLEDRLTDIQCPVFIIQGDQDQVVDPKSAQLIFDKLKSSNKVIEIVASDRHGILNENIGKTQEKVLDYLAGLLQHAD